KRRLEALQAMQLFAAHGYAAEASEAALSLPAVCELEQLAYDDEAALEGAIYEVLLTAGERAQPALLAALRGNSANQKCCIVYYRRRREHTFALYGFAKTVLDKDETVRLAAIEMLASNLDKNGVMEILRKSLRDGNVELRRRIVQYLDERCEPEKGVE